MILPTVHLNGTSLEDLLAQAREAQEAMRAAVAAVAAAMPHGRDYYLQGPDAGAQARAEHERRLEAARAVEKDMAELVRHLRRVERVRDEAARARGGAAGVQ